MSLRSISLTQVLFGWGFLTVIACCAFVFYARSLPPDELVMANELSFQVLTSLIVIGLPSVGALFALLLLGAFLKRRRHRPVEVAAQS